MYCRIDNIDLNKLCTLVEDNPVIWDSTSEGYKNSRSRYAAWERIFKNLNAEYIKTSKEKRVKFGSAVKLKWKQLRDSYFRSKTSCPYNMKFLENSIINSTESFSNTEEFFISEESFVVGSPKKGFTSVFTKDKLLVKTSVAKRNHNKVKPPKTPEIDIEAETKGFSNSLDFFLQSIIPQLNRFSNSEYIEFQIGLLQVIANIYKKRKQNPSLNPQPES